MANIRNTDVFKVNVRGKSQDEAISIAERLLETQKNVVNKNNQENIATLVKLKNYVEIIKQKVRESSQEEREIILCEYNAAQFAFQLEYMRNTLEGNDNLVENGIMVNSGPVFPDFRLFMGLAGALSFIGVTLLLITFAKK